MTDLQLIKFAIQRLKVLGYGSQKEIGKLLGYTNESSFSQVLNGKVNIPADLIDRIAGLNDDIKNFIIENRSDIKSNTDSNVRLEAIPLRLADPDGYESTPDKFYELADGSLIMQVPIIPQRAYAGYLRGYADPEFYEDLMTIPLPVDKRHSGAYLGFEVSGNSMVCLDSEELAERSIWPGRIAIGRELSRHQWQYKLHTHNYDTWIIVHKTEGILIKEIVKHDVENCVITVHSLNPKYEDQELHLNDVEQIFSVVQIIKKAR